MKYVYVQIKKSIPENKVECAKLRCRECAYQPDGTVCIHTRILGYLEDDKK